MRLGEIAAKVIGIGAIVGLVLGMGALVYMGITHPTPKTTPDPPSSVSVRYCDGAILAPNQTCPDGTTDTDDFMIAR